MAPATEEAEAGEGQESSGMIALGDEAIIEEYEPEYATLFTTQEEAAGRAIFERVCSECHGIDELSNDQFVSDWAGASIADLYRYISENMPDDNAGGLDEEEYEHVTAYILARNGYPSSMTEFDSRAERLQSIPFERIGG